MRITIDLKKCSGCAVCHEYCSKHMLAAKKGKTYVKEGCDACGYCIQFCICRAISLKDDLTN